MSRIKYHFLVLRHTPQGSSLFPVAGQTIGRGKTVNDVLVKDVRGSAVLARLRKKHSEGDIFVTTTLKDEFGCYSAKDAILLSEALATIDGPMISDCYNKIINHE